LLRDKRSVPVKYSIDPRRISADDFWQAAKKHALGRTQKASAASESENVDINSILNSLKKRP
jgi:hypothetical protein